MPSMSELDKPPSFDQTEFDATRSSFIAMTQRCRYSGNVHYHDRGINISEEWSGPNGFSVFLNDMGLRPFDKTLDRIDNSKGYSKDNCKWSTPLEQSNNQRGNYNIEYGGVVKSISVWGRELGIPRTTLRKRILAWGVDLAFMTKPFSPPDLVLYRGELKSLTDWSTFLGINRKTIVSRLHRGATIEEAFIK